MPPTDFEPDREPRTYLSAAIISWLFVFAISIFLFVPWALTKLKFTKIAGYYIEYSGDKK